MSDDERRLARLMARAIHKLAIEIERGTASPREEYDAAIARLDEFKKAFVK